MAIFYNYNNSIGHISNSGCSFVSMGYVILFSRLYLCFGFLFSEYYKMKLKYSSMNALCSFISVIAYLDATPTNQFFPHIQIHKSGV